MAKFQFDATPNLYSYSFKMPENISSEDFRSLQEAFKLYPTMKLYKEVNHNSKVNIALFLFLIGLVLVVLAFVFMKNGGYPLIILPAIMIASALTSNWVNSKNKKETIKKYENQLDLLKIMIMKSINYSQFTIDYKNQFWFFFSEEAKDRYLMELTNDPMKMYSKRF